MGGKIQRNVHDGNLIGFIMKRAGLGTRLGVWVGLDTNLLIYVWMYI